jgi:glycosyltransferase involved in cell wall biosynthesis
MRVLSISGPLPTDQRPGSLAPVARQIESLRRCRVSVTVVEITGRPKVKYLQAIPRMRRELADVDLVHAHFGYSGWVGLLQRRRPVVISFMGNDLLGTRRADGKTTWGSWVAIRANRIAARAADAVIVKSAGMAAVLGEMPVHIIPNGVDMEIFSPTDRIEARRSLGWPLDGLTVLFPGNPDFPNKGFELVKQAIERASEHLRIKIDLRVLWGVPPVIVPQMMSGSDVMVLASQSEGSPNVVKEALACELPIVATRVGDVPELLEGFRSCRLSERTAPAIAEALQTLLVARPPREGRALLLSRGLDQASVAQRIVRVYEFVLGRTAPQK